MVDQEGGAGHSSRDRNLRLDAMLTILLWATAAGRFATFPNVILRRGKFPTGEYNAKGVAPCDGREVAQARVRPKNRGATFGLSSNLGEIFGASGTTPSRHDRAPLREMVTVAPMFPNYIVCDPLSELGPLL